MMAQELEATDTGASHQFHRMLKGELGKKLGHWLEDMRNEIIERLIKVRRHSNTLTKLGSIPLKRVQKYGDMGLAIEAPHGTPAEDYVSIAKANKSQVNKW